MRINRILGQSAWEVEGQLTPSTPRLRDLCAISSVHASFPSWDMICFHRMNVFLRHYYRKWILPCRRHLVYILNKQDVAWCEIGDASSTNYGLRNQPNLIHSNACEIFIRLCCHVFQGTLRCAASCRFIRVPSKRRPTLPLIQRVDLRAIVRPNARLFTTNTRHRKPSSQSTLWRSHSECQLRFVVWRKRVNTVHQFRLDLWRYCVACETISQSLIMKRTHCNNPATFSTIAELVTVAM
jgi:hypothetical protein